MFKYSHNHKKYFSKNGDKVTYEKGHLIVDKFSKSAYVFFLDEGIIKASIRSRNDSLENIIGYFFPGATFAQSGSFFEDSSKTLDYEVVESSTLYRLEREEFLKNLQKDNSFSLAYLQTVLINNLFLIERINYLGEKNALAKLSNWILFMNKFYGVDYNNKRMIPIPITQDSIASFIGTTRESVNKSLVVLKDSALIRIQKKKIIINSIEKLKKFSRSI